MRLGSMKKDMISTNERLFIVQALKEELRIDGRNPYDHRKITYQFSLDDCSATVGIGHTKVMTVVSATLGAPYEDRASEGSLRFNVDFLPMASPAFEGGRPGEAAVEANRLLERAFRNAGAVDLEALCVVAGVKAWHLQLDVHALDHDGNLLDACMLSALAALMAFRRPDTEVAAAAGEGASPTVTLLSPDVREPLPLSLHQLPLAITFALFEDGELLVVDPSLKEEAASAGVLTVVVNTYSDICSLNKTCGAGISMTQVHRMVRLANSRAGEVIAGLKAALQAHDSARVAARVRRHSGALAQPSQGGRSVTVLASSDISGAVAGQAADLDAGAGRSAMSEGSSSEGDEVGEISGGLDGVQDMHLGGHGAQHSAGLRHQQGEGLGATPLQQIQQTAVAGVATQGKPRVTAVGIQAHGRRDLLSATASISNGEAADLDSDLAELQAALMKRGAMR